MPVGSFVSWEVWLRLYLLLCLNRVTLATDLSCASQTGVRIDLDAKHFVPVEANAPDTPGQHSAHQTGMSNLRTITLVVLGLSKPGLAVEPGLPSRTAVITAAARAIATHDPDPSVRNPDWLAEHLLGSSERRLLAGTPWSEALDGDYRGIAQNPEVDTLVRSMLVRTRFIDERLRDAVKNGAAQIVVLGAGFDSRAYRLRELLQRARVFELDFGSASLSLLARRSRREERPQ